MAISRRLRIAWVIDTWDGVKTGGVVSARRFVDALRERHEVTLLTAGKSAPGRVGLPSFHVPPFGRVMRQMGFVFAVPVRSVLEDVFRRVDVVHVQFPFWLGMRAAKIARRMGAPLVAGFHVQPENMFANVGIHSEALSAWTYRLFVRELFDLADAVVCPSRFALEVLRHHGLSAPAVIVSNGIAGAFRPRAPEAAERPRDRVLVLAVGRLAREKRLDVVIEGIRRSRHASRIALVVTGRGPEEERVRRLGAALPVPAYVTFVSDEELVRLMGAADLLVHASEVELEGMAVLEALGCGTPALVADAPLSAARDLAVSPEFLFHAGDPADLARRLDALIERPELLRAARAICLERARDLTLEASVQRLEEIYLRVAAARPVTRAAAPAAPPTAPPAAP